MPLSTQPPSSAPAPAPDGRIALVLHAHLPYVRHPEHDDFLEERWFFEAMAETYLPLVAALTRLEDDGVDYHLLLSLSPTLVAMMEDELLRERFPRHLQRVQRLADREAERLARARSPRAHAAAFHADFYRDARHWFENRCGGRVAGAFARLAAGGRLELMTCAATHGFLPLLADRPGAVRAQLHTAADYHQQVFGVRPEGLWLPECAYAPGLEKAVVEAGFRYTFIDAPSLERARPSPPRGLFAPVYADNGLAFFARDRETSYQVWAAEVGYPGHPDYREFHRDQGWALPEEEVREFLVAGRRTPTGLKFDRVTGKVDDKAPYDPEAARERAARHAEDFVKNREAQAAHLAARMDRPPLVTAMYDAELFGHWWFEGVWFLEYVLRKLCYDTPRVKTTSPRRYLAEYPENHVVGPAAGSWGRDGNFEYWVNADTDRWLPELARAATRMNERAKDLLAADAALVFRAAAAKTTPKTPTGTSPGTSIGAAPDARAPSATEPSAALGEAYSLRVLKQMARELLLAQASDWPFIMRTGTSPEYAARRVAGHLARFGALDRMLDSGVDERALEALEYADRLFPDIDPRVHAVGD